jgi:hypothetical protein
MMIHLIVTKKSSYFYNELVYDIFVKNLMMNIFSVIDQNCLIKFIIKVVIL